MASPVTLAQNDPPSGYRWVVLFAFTGLMVQSSFGGFLYSTLGTFVVKDLGLSSAQLGFLASAPFLGTLVTTLGAGVLVDRIGVKAAVITASGVIAVSLLVGSLSPGFALLAVSAVCVGFGISFIQPLTNKGVTVWFPRSMWALAVSLKQSGIPAGTALQALLLPALAETNGWQTGFRILAGFALAWGLLCAWLYRERAGATGSRPRPDGAAGVAVALAMLRDSPGTLGSCLIGFTMGALTLSLSTFFVPYLRDVLGLSVVKATQALALLNIVSGMVRPFIGLLCDQLFSGALWKGLGWLTLAAGAMALVFAAIRGPVPGAALTALVVVAGIISLSWSGVYFAVVAAFNGADRAGASSGLAALCNALGTATGPFVFGIVLNATHSYSVGLVMYAIICLLSAAVLVFLVRRDATVST